MHGANWYDYGARLYDPVLGRWHTVDPLAEVKHWIAPYHYCSNNPANRIDPDGRIDWEVVGKGALTTLGGIGSVVAATFITPTGFGIPAAAYLYTQGATATSFGIGQMLYGAVSDPSAETKDKAASLPNDALDLFGIVADQTVGNTNKEFRKVAQVTSLVLGVGTSETIVKNMPTLITNASRAISATQATLLSADIINAGSNSTSENINQEEKKKSLDQTTPTNTNSPLAPKANTLDFNPFEINKNTFIPSQNY